jgi:branched-chain amino acid transport system ATP-binding protein
MSAPALRATGLCKSFGALKVTDDVNLSLAPGARTALIGPNGAGKTTLVNLLSGVTRPEAGRIEIFGEDVSAASPSHRTRRGLVRTFQITSLYANLSVLENIYIAVSEHAGNSFNLWRAAGKQSALLERADQLIQRLRLGDDRHSRVCEIAYGRQRLVEIALALALEPKVLLLDEPAAGIPSNELDLLLRAVQDLPREIAVLMIEHDMEMVRRFATEVTVLVQGRVLITGSPESVMANAEVQAVYLGSAGTQRFEAGMQAQGGARV